MFTRLIILIIAGWVMQIVGSGILSAGEFYIPAYGELRATVAALGALLVAILFIGACARRAIHAAAQE